MKKKIISLAITVSLSSFSAQAGMPVFDATNFAQLVKNFQSIKQQIDQFNEYQKQFETYQKQFDKVKKLQEKLDTAKDALRDGNLSKALSGINDVLSIPSDINGALAYNQAEIDKKIREIDAKLASDEVSSVEKGLLRSRRSQLEIAKTLASLTTTASENIGKMSKEESVNESHKINATNTSILARLAIAENKRNTEIDMRRKSGIAEVTASVTEAGDMFEQLSEK